MRATLRDARVERANFVAAARIASSQIDHERKARDAEAARVATPVNEINDPVRWASSLTFSLLCRLRAEARFSERSYAPLARLP